MESTISIGSCLITKINYKQKDYIMITNDQMIMQTLDNISNLNDQIQIHLNILSNLDLIGPNALEIHDQVTSISQGHNSIQTGTTNAISIIDPIIMEDDNE